MSGSINAISLIPSRGVVSHLESLGIITAHFKKVAWTSNDSASKTDLLD